MKNRKFAKITLLVLSLVLVLVATFAMSISADGEETVTPEIISQNVSYTDKFALMYAVDASTVEAAPVTLYLYDNVPGEETSYTKKYTAENITTGEDSGLGIDAYIFTTDGVGATALANKYYVQAVDANGNTSALKKYSVAEYLYERLASTGDKTPTPDQKEFYLNTIDFGTNAQIVLGDTNTLLSDYSYVIVNGVAKGIYPVGTRFSPYVGGITANWTVISTDDEGTETTETQERAFTVSEGIKTVATVVADSIVPFRSGIDTFTTSTLCDFKSISQKAYSSDGKFYSFNGNPKYAYVTDEERGTVAVFDLTTRGNQVNLAVNNTDVALEDATAFECSFDIKMDMSTTCDNNNSSNLLEGLVYRYMRWRVSDTDTSSVKELLIYGNTKASGATEWTTTGLYIKSDGSAANQLSADVNTEDWFHVRMVVYKDDPYNAHFFINGVKGTVVAALSTTTYNGDISTLTGMTFLQYNCSYVYVYIDNLYCGLINESTSTETE